MQTRACDRSSPVKYALSFRILRRGRCSYVQPRDTRKPIALAGRNRVTRQSITHARRTVTCATPRTPQRLLRVAAARFRWGLLSRSYTLWPGAGEAGCLRALPMSSAVVEPRGINHSSGCYFCNSRKSVFIGHQK